MDEEKKFDEMIFEYSDVLVSFLEKKLSIKESNFFRGDFSLEYLEGIDSLMHANTFVITIKKIA